MRDKKPWTKPDRVGPIEAHYAKVATDHRESSEEREAAAKNADRIRQVKRAIGVDDWI